MGDIETTGYMTDGSSITTATGIIYCTTWTSSPVYYNYDTGEFIYGNKKEEAKRKGCKAHKFNILWQEN